MNENYLIIFKKLLESNTVYYNGNLKKIALSSKAKLYKFVTLIIRRSLKILI